MEEDIHFQVLTPNLLVLGQTPVITNADLTDIEDKDLQKRKNYK